MMPRHRRAGVDSPARPAQYLTDVATDDERPEPVVVPPASLTPETLRAVVESFVLREGTDYGERDVSLDDKVRDVLRQLERGEAEIVFDPASESIDLVPAGRPPRR
jgi:uncharacterized protein YheU (UPF0270 family)